jgi:hypothetical protein
MVIHSIINLNVFPEDSFSIFDFIHWPLQDVNLAMQFTILNSKLHAHIRSASEQLKVKRKLFTMIILIRNLLLLID